MLSIPLREDEAVRAGNVHVIIASSLIAYLADAPSWAMTAKINVI